MRAGPEGEALVRQASAVERNWLPESHLVVSDEVFFHPTQKRLAARRRTAWEGVVLEEVAIPVPQDEPAARILAEAAIARWEQVFPADNPAVSGLLARVRSLGEWMPELDLPPFDDPQLHHVAALLCHQARSLDDLRKAPWLEALRSLLGPQRLAIVDREAPERLPVPSGSRISLQYEPGRPPVLAVRIQEVFGLKETPRIAGGRVAVLLHLLGPNHRPQQVTDDLLSFWTNTYPALRKELRRRYPRHAWPEDPWTAVAEKRPQKRKE